MPVLISSQVTIFFPEKCVLAAGLAVILSNSKNVFPSWMAGIKKRYWYNYEGKTVSFFQLKIFCRSVILDSRILGSETGHRYRTKMFELWNPKRYSCRNTKNVKFSHKTVFSYHAVLISLRALI